MEASEFAYVPKDTIDISEEAKKEVAEFLNAVDDNDDVQRIFTALK